MHADGSRRRNANTQLRFNSRLRSPERRSCMHRLPRASNGTSLASIRNIVHLYIRSATQPGVCDEKHRNVTECTVTDRRTSAFSDAMVENEEISRRSPLIQRIRPKCLLVINIWRQITSFEGRSQYDEWPMEVGTIGKVVTRHPAY
jgi:hypothetical protein